MTKKYISDHDIFDLDIGVDKTFFVHVGNTMEELSQNLYHLFFLEYLELFFKAK